MIVLNNLASKSFKQSSPHLMLHQQAVAYVATAGTTQQGWSTPWCGGIHPADFTSSSNVILMLNILIFYLYLYSWLAPVRIV